MTTYGKVHRYGSRPVADILAGSVRVEEKIDGSQFSFGRDAYGHLWCESKNRRLDLDAPGEMFAKAVASVLRVEACLKPGVIYYGESVSKPRHNKLAYDRAPNGGLVLFDPSDRITSLAVQMKVEVVPCLFEGEITPENLEKLIAGPSFLGGTREGIVIKRGAMKAKLVCASFAERKPHVPKGAQGVAGIIDQYRTKARWDKAIQHLREDGALQGEPRDVPKIIGEISRDLHEECETEIRLALWPKIWNEIRKGVVAGSAEHYLSTLDE